MDYAEIAQDVLADLKADGVSTTLTQVSGGTYDPAAGSITGQNTATKTVYGLLQAPTMPQSGNTGNRWFNGTLIQANDKFLFLAALDTSGAAITPAVGNALTINGIVFTIAALIPIEPSGVTLAYRVLARK